MQYIEKQHLPKYLQIIQTTQFLGEYFGSKQTEKRIYQFFLALEILKLLVKLRKWKLVDKWGLMISDNNNYGEVDNKEEQNAQEFKQKWGNLEYDPSITDPKQIKQKLQQLKEESPKFNLSYYDSIGDKNISLLTTLPIPEDFKKKDYESKINRIRIKVGEVLHLIRPIIYCIFILKFGSQSYTPYIISLVIDLLRYLIQLNVKLFRKSQQEELKLRTKESIMCYILRNPFYSEIFRKKVLDKILGLFLKSDGWIYRIIISIIEIRSSKCLLL